MLFLANAIMKSPNQALMWTMMLGAATLVLSPIGLLSGAAVALVTLSAGLMPGVRALVAALLGGLLMAVFSEQWFGLSIAMLEFWVPAFVLAVVYGRSASLSRMIQVATTIVVLGLLLTHLLLGSTEVFWGETMRQLLDGWTTQGVEIEPQAADLMLEQLPMLLTMLVAIGLLMVWVSMLLLARWWQTKLYAMDAFARSFQQLSLGNHLAILLGVVLLVVLFVPTQLLFQDVLGVLSVAFMLQGLAVIHYWQAVKQTSKGWLILVYVLLGVLPHMIVLVASLGWLENWINWRNKITSDSQS